MSHNLKILSNAESAFHGKPKLNVSSKVLKDIFIKFETKSFDDLSVKVQLAQKKKNSPYQHKTIQLLYLNFEPLLKSKFCTVKYSMTWTALKNLSWKACVQSISNSKKIYLTAFLFSPFSVQWQNAYNYTLMTQLPLQLCMK